jgi:hypothetical protein
MIKSFNVTGFQSQQVVLSNHEEPYLDGSFNLVGVSSDANASKYQHSFGITASCRNGEAYSTFTYLTHFTVETDGTMIPDGGYSNIESRTKLVDMLQIAIAHARGCHMVLSNIVNDRTFIQYVTHDELWDIIKDPTKKIW